LNFIRRPEHSHLKPAPARTRAHFHTAGRRICDADFSAASGLRWRKAARKIRF
jgi:hypothetical protein